MRRLPADWAPAGASPEPVHDAWDTAYSLWLIAAVLFGLALGFGGELLLATRP